MSELISIIVPVYNVDAYIQDCLNSIARQTYKNIEVIMVDDGSTDASGQICDRYCELDERFHVIHKKNVGVSSARNSGLEAARGEYIGFVDPDDWIDEYMYEMLYADMSEHDVDVVTCAYYEIYRSSTTIKSFPLRGMVSSDKALESLMLYFDAYLWCRLYRRQVFDGIRFIEGRNYEDVEAMPRLILNCKYIFFDDRPMYYYRLKREGSIVATNNVKNIQDYFYSYMDILKNMKQSRPDFAGLAIKGAAIGYIVQCKRLAMVERLTKEQRGELRYYKRIFLEEIKGIRRKSGLSSKEKIELFLSLYCTGIFMWLFKWCGRREP